MASNNPEKIRVPAPILTIFHLILAILLRRLMPLPIPVPAFVPWLGLGFAALGFILGLLALTEFRRARARAVSGLKKSTAGFVSTGIYHYTRNPIYLGFVFMLMGLALSMGTYWGVILAWPLVVFMNNLVIKPEEISLEKRFKDQYIDYKSKVRRWL